MSEERVIRLKHEREDTPTHSIFKRWKYELLVKHWKKTFAFFLFFILCFLVTWVLMGVEKWYLGFVGIFILLFHVVKWIGIGIWFIASRAWWSFLFSPLIYIIIKQFIHVEEIGFRELGSKFTYFFKITTLADGYLLHEDAFFGLSKRPIYLDKTTIEYIRETGEQRVLKRKGQKDKTYLEVDIVPLYWRNDPLLIRDEETKKKFVNNAILVNEHVRDYYTLVVKGMNPSDRETEKELIYDKILETSDLKKEIIRLKREIREWDVENLSKVAEVLIPHSSDELRRFKGILKVTTKDYDQLAKKIEGQTALLELLQQREEPLTEEELAQLAAMEELD